MGFAHFHGALPGDHYAYTTEENLNFYKNYKSYGFEIF